MNSKYIKISLGIIVAVALIGFLIAGFSTNWFSSKEDSNDDDVIPVNDNGLLREYINRLDINQITGQPVFDYKILKEENNGNGNKTVWLGVHSVTYLTPEASDQYVWSHQVVIFLHDKLKNSIFNTSRAIVYLDGVDASAEDPPIKTENNDLLNLIWDISYDSNVVGVFITRIPPRIKYEGEDSRHSEDDLMAVFWQKYLFEGKNIENTFFAPMAKAAMKCVDAVEDYLQQVGTENQYENDFKYVITGASKRGWTSWLVAAMDQQRTQAALPVVMSMANIQQHLHRMNRIYNNNWPFTFEWLVRRKLMGEIDSSNYTDLMSIVDPINYDYHDKLIYLESSTSDEFFLPDDIIDYWNDSPQIRHKLFRLVPKSEHSMIGHLKTIREQSAKVVTMINNNQNKEESNLIIPNMSFRRDSNKWTILIENVQKILNVKIYRTENRDQKMRDFRVAALREKKWGDDSYESKDIRPRFHQWTSCAVNSDFFSIISQSYRNFCNTSNSNQTDFFGKFLKDYEFYCDGENPCDYTFETDDLALLYSEEVYNAFYLEFDIILVNSNDTGLRITTPLFVEPEYLPGDRCYGDVCNGGLC